MRPHLQVQLYSSCWILLTRVCQVGCVSVIGKSTKTFSSKPDPRCAHENQGSGGDVMVGPELESESIALPHPCTALKCPAAGQVVSSWLQGRIDNISRPSTCDAVPNSLGDATHFSDSWGCPGLWGAWSGTTHLLGASVLCRNGCVDGR
ncbi:hypothetical protein FA15DRAFT_63980 [Coprinopsis marcescibilis]|uniref:Secreted protein n=1 Tax=Coprinopsis marcescibilis TaxID=230819 RepID=A0A5C3KP60_COPMA|nr:hypothetical protein FA15DRAFT_63980 [Coprinopsis marcescibilis]